MPSTIFGMILTYGEYALTRSHTECEIKSVLHFCHSMTKGGHYGSMRMARWVEAKATKANDAKTIMEFVKSNIFYRFGVSKALIND
ncbi:hypothetical protein CR513_47595, partial [Mucuna pruriens]